MKNNSLKETIEKINRNFAKIKANMPIEEDILYTYHNIMDSLEKGEIRCVERIGDNWIFNEWVKKAILIGMYIGKKEISQNGVDCFIDYDTLPLRKISMKDRIRVVAPSSGIRRGAYVGPDTVLMPPAYVNIGAFLKGNSVIESLAGSCCYIGENVHISSNVTIGGVLSPVEAFPVVIGNNVLIGEGAGITQGSRVNDNTIIAPGVHISKATPIIDPFNNIAYTNMGIFQLISHKNEKINFYEIGDLIKSKDSSYGPEVPKNSLVINGVMLSKCGTLKVVPLIAKIVDKPINDMFEDEWLFGQI